jgi:hypothetical protein
MVGDAAALCHPSAQAPSGGSAASPTFNDNRPLQGSHEDCQLAAGLLFPAVHSVATLPLLRDRETHCELS